VQQSAQELKKKKRTFRKFCDVFFLPFQKSYKLKKMLTHNNTRPHTLSRARPAPVHTICFALYAVQKSKFQGCQI
jgi:hypothetical protein